MKENELDFDNSNLIAGIKLIYRAYVDNLKLVLSVILISFVLGFLYSLTLSPKFLVSATVVPSENNAQASYSFEGIQENVMGAFLGDDNTSNYAGLGNLIMTMFSQEVADVLWSKGYSDIFYKANFDEKTGLYFKGQPPILDRLAAKVLGYEIDNELTSADFRNMIVSSFIVEDDIIDFTPNIVIQVVSSEPEKFKGLMEDLLDISDKHLKQEKLNFAKNQIEYLNGTIDSVRDYQVKTSLINSIKSKHLEVALLQNDLPYLTKVVNKPTISQNPVSPRLAFIYIFFSFIGFGLVSIRIFYKDFF